MLEKRIKQLKDRLKSRILETNKLLYEINSTLREIIEENEQIVDLNEIFCNWKGKCTKN